MTKNVVLGSCWFECFVFVSLIHKQWRIYGSGPEVLVLQPMLRPVGRAEINCSIP